MTGRLMRAGAASVIAVLLPAIAATAQTSMPRGETGQRGTKRGPVLESISGFSVVLVVGETQPSGSASPDTLPSGAKKALSDMREFLPYKSYRVLDTQWMACCAPNPTTTIAGRLQGVTGIPGPNGSVNLSPRPYAFSIAASVSGVNIPVRFVLALEDTGNRRASEHADRAREMERERQDVQAEAETVEAQVRNLQQRVEIGTASALDVRPLQDRYASLQRRLRDMTVSAESASLSGRSIIDSSFTMDAGETVVVGTSKLGGDKALIALVTAVRKSGQGQGRN
jgi:hypothetical protein